MKITYNWDEVPDYFREATRMCDTIGDCDECPLNGLKVVIPCQLTKASLELANPEKEVEIVKEWAKEHPVKTRQSELLKIFPDAQLDDDGMFNFSLKPCDIDPEYADKVCDQYSDCQDCQREYWSEEVEYEFKK